MHWQAQLAIATVLVVFSPAAGLAQPPFGITWGGDGDGELGDGLPIADQSSPVGVLDGSGGCCLDGVVDIQGGDTSSLALDNQQRIWTWGSNFAGQLGIGPSPASSAIPVQVTALVGQLPTTPAQETIALEGGHTLVVRSNGTIAAWGANDHGQLGIGPPGPASCGVAPGNFPCQTSPVFPALNNVFGVGAGRDHSLAVVGDCAAGGDAYAWGANGGGQLGDNSTTERYTPVQVHGPADVGFLTGVAKMVGGEGHTVAMMCDGSVLSWGVNGSGQLGHGNMDDSLVPALVVTQCASPPRPLLGCPLLNVVDVAAGYQHSIAMDANGDVWFWGDNSFGQLCDGTNNNLVFATKVLSGGLTVAATGLPLDVVAGGSIFSLVLLSNSTVVACGLNPRGNLGDCSQNPSSTPVTVLEGPSCNAPLPFVLLVEAGEIHSLAIGDQVPVTPTPAGTATPTVTGSQTTTQTATRTRTATASGTPTPTRTPTHTQPPSPTATPTETPTATPSFVVSRPPTPTPTPTRSYTPTSTPTSTCIPAPPNLVGWWPGDNSPSDISGFANDGVLQGAATYTAGQVNAAFSFSATADFVEVPDDPVLNFAGPFSIDAWVRTTNTTTAAIIDKRTGTSANPVGYHLFLFGGVLGFQLGDGLPFTNYNSPGPAINDGNWHQVAVTVDRASQTGGRLYVDGQLALTFDPTGHPGSIANTASLRFGQRYLSPAQPFQGGIDEVEIFDRALTLQEIQAIFNARSVGKCKTPVPTVTPTPTASASFTATRTATPTPTCAEPISVDISTGRNSVPVGNSDQIWSLIAAPPGTTNFSPGPATVIAPNGAWGSLPNAQWISANTGCTNTTTTDCPGGVYSYKLCWEQCGPLVPESLQILVDNIADVFIDGGLVTTVPGFNTPTTIPGFTLGTGMHMLQVDVHNNPYSGGGGTATGMDLSGHLNGSVKIVPCEIETPTFTATATSTPTATPTRTPTATATSTPTPTCGEPISLLISSGTNASVGNSDPIWSLIAAPPGTTGFSPGPATVITPNSAWTTLANTQWISANTGCSTTTTTDCPGGLYSYQLCWEQCGPLVPESLQILADNSADVFLDSTPVTTVSGFTSPATIPGFALATGKHVLRVDVHNAAYSGGGGTATGMDLSGTLNGAVKIVPCKRMTFPGDANCNEQLEAGDLAATATAAFDPIAASLCDADCNQDGDVTAADIACVLQRMNASDS